MIEVVGPVVRRMDDAPANPVPRARGATMQVLAGPAEALANLVMRRFTLEPGGRIPAHRHPDLEHGQLVLDGELVLSLDGARSTVRAGDVVTIPAGVAHWYENRSASPARFLCVIPNVKDYRTEWLEES